MTTQPATPPAIKYLSFSAGIDQQTVEILIRLMSNYHNEGVQEVYLTLATPGGEPRAGVHLYNYLRGLPFRLTVHNVGYVDSTGITVFLAGDRRYANPNATFTFHGVSIKSLKDQSLDEPQLREKLKIILRDQERLGAIYQERTDLDKKAVSALFRKAENKDAEWAAEHGLIQEIKELQIPPGSRVDTVVIPRKGT